MVTFVRGLQALGKKELFFFVFSLSLISLISLSLPSLQSQSSAQYILSSTAPPPWVASWQGPWYGTIPKLLIKIHHQYKTSLWEAFWHTTLWIAFQQEMQHLPRRWFLPAPQKMAFQCTQSHMQLPRVPIPPPWPPANFLPSDDNSYSFFTRSRSQPWIGGGGGIWVLRFVLSSVDMLQSQRQRLFPISSISVVSRVVLPFLQVFFCFNDFLC